MESDKNPTTTMNKFIEELGTDELSLDPGRVSEVHLRLSNPDVLMDRLKRILNSNFVKMTFPVFNALFDGALEYTKQTVPVDVKNAIIDGHIIAIDLSEPMDRIVDKDEDLDYLDDYRLLSPYILEVAREKITMGGDSVLKAFEAGFKDALAGQYVDVKLKQRPKDISDENMTECYKKYRSVMGTAGRNMALNQRPLGDIFHLGMAKAGECVGCGNEIEDALANGQIKIPSWPLYYYINTHDARKGFDLTMKKSEIYLQEAKLALTMLPDEFDLRPFLEFLFLTVNHYNQHWYNVLNRASPFEKFQKALDPNIV
jgi:hypothetical protein